jgi:ATP-dependent DNA helicase RecQ
VINAVIGLPKPVIVYVLFPQHAENIARSLRRVGISRIGVFTGATSPSERERLIDQWGDSQIDIMVATSAFGLGMDKADVRSVIHAAVPENLDRFYQEVGRGGRDGFASQSLVLFHDQQIPEARKLNNERLITVELGLKKWRAMWDHGEVLPNGRRCVHVSTLRVDQKTRTDRNEEWNWRTLLLMQRAGLIRIEFNEPSLPSIEPEASAESYRETLKSYFDSYYDKVTIVPLTDDPLNESIWDVRTRQRRDFEKSEQTRGLQRLLTWLSAPSDKALCYILMESYTIDGTQPEYSCGGCPKCLADYSDIDTPMVGSSASARGVEHATEWGPPLSGSPSNLHIYFPRGDQRVRRIIRNWRGWLRRLLEKKVIQAIRADVEVLEILEKELKSSAFWIGDLSDSIQDNENMFWPQLVLQFDENRLVHDLGFSESVRIVIAPEEVSDASNPNRRWWQSVPAAVSLDNFLTSLET